MVTKPAKPTEASIAIARIETLLAERDCVFVAIDGPCTSGKTTFAAMLNRRFGGNVLHMDDFFLRPEQRTPERFAEPGGNVDRERFETEVLAPLAAGQAAQYRPWDCHTGDFAVAYAVEPAQLTIVEGSYSMHPALRRYYDCMICLAVDLPNSCAGSNHAIHACCNDSSTSGFRWKTAISKRPISKPSPICSSTPRCRTVGRSSSFGMTYTHIRREGNIKEKTKCLPQPCPRPPCAAPTCRN